MLNTAKSVFYNYILPYFEYATKTFYTFHVRPYYSNDYNIEQVDYVKNKRIAIIIQGGILYKNNFTYETIKLYKYLYPNTEIILSTWNYEKIEYINMIKKLNIHVILSDPPTMTGHGNLNFQLTSTKAAINFAKKLNVDYILKTRTDQRICAENSLSYLLNLLTLFPIKLELQNIGRIAVLSSGCFKGRLYNISDMMLFGKTSDIERYFSVTLDLRNSIDFSQDNQIEYSKNRPGEIYIASHYIESLGFKLKWSISDSEFFFKELFVIVDAETLDWYWPKYTTREFRWRLYSKSYLKPYTFKDWLDLYLSK